MGLGYFTCSEPRLNFNDTQNELTMNFRNKNGRNVFTLSLNRTAGAFHLITHKYDKVINRTKLDLPDSSNELQLNINRSSVHAKTQESWRKLDIPETKEIFSLYFRSSHPPFCITCRGFFSVSIAYLGFSYFLHVICVSSDSYARLSFLSTFTLSP